MNNKVKVALAAALAMGATAPAFAEPASGNAVAVAIGASFMPVHTSTVISGEFGFEGTVQIPALEIAEGAQASITLPWPVGQRTGPVTGETVATTAPVSGTGEYSLSIESTQMELVSLSAAAASGTTAVASSAANGLGGTGATSGATMDSHLALHASSAPDNSGQYTSQVLINGGFVH